MLKERSPLPPLSVDEVFRGRNVILIVSRAHSHSLNGTPGIYEIVPRVVSLDEMNVEQVNREGYTTGEQQ